MNLTLHLQKLDDLIVAHTQPPVTTILRNHLHPLLDQMEAYVAATDEKIRVLTEDSQRKDERITEQVQAMAQLQRQHDQEITNLFFLEAQQQRQPAPPPDPTRQGFDAGG